MNRLTTYTFISAAFLLSACVDVGTPNFKELGWEDLKPQQENIGDNSLALSSLEANSHWYEDDYAQGGGLSGMYSGPPPQAYSGGVVAEVDGTSVRIPGFVVPVEFDGENLVTEFFLVPYFGACFHMPPPPTNQTIYVISPKPIEYESLYDPVWVMGVIRTEQIGNDIATAAYRMDLQRLAPYEE